MAKINILSIDGGGIKGIISAILIEKLEKILKGTTGNPQFKIADCFDLVAGTSTGAILSGIYLCPDKDGRPKYSASDALEMYVKNGGSIFKKSKLWELKTFYGMFGAKYNNKNLIRILEEYLGDLETDELIKPCIFTSYDMGKGVPTIFTSRMGTETGHNTYVRDILLASSAAPTYFPPIRIASSKEKNSFFIDGGVFSNSPALCAVIEALKMTDSHHLDDISVLSVGNIRTPGKYEYEKAAGYGLLNWIVPSIDIMMEGSMQAVHGQLKTMYQSIGRPWQYMRIDAGKSPNGQAPKMDDASPENIKRLVKTGEELAYESAHKLRKFAETLLAHRSGE